MAAAGKLVDMEMKRTLSYLFTGPAQFSPPLDEASR
jgi:hypothetical protein